MISLQKAYIYVYKDEQSQHIGFDVTNLKLYIEFSTKL